MGLRVLLLTALALSFFAANSVLCRLALGDGNSDPFSFTVIRLLAGSATLLVLYVITTSKQSYTEPSATWRLLTSAGSWLGGLSLFLYALSFSWAYIALEAGTGALLLFGAVQLTLIVASFWRGNKLAPLEWVGLAIAFSGLVYLMLPNLQTPAWKALVSMLLSGLAWGIYTLLGKKASEPAIATLGNFLRTLPFCLLLLLFTHNQLQLTTGGFYLALISGAFASGLGYVVWYKALVRLSEIQAGVVQLQVPILAAIGGALFVSEPIELRLVVASIWVLSGILLVLIAKKCH